MHRVCVVVFLMCLPPCVRAQGDLNGYLATHRYAFSLDSGFDMRTRDTLRRELSPYRLVLQAEGGSHYLSFYGRLPMVWIPFLHEDLGLSHFFLEAGYSSAVLGNHFLQTGDTGYIISRNKTFWQLLFVYDGGLVPAEKVAYFGVDFERTQTYVRALKMLLPASAPPASIQSYIDLIHAATDTLYDCDYILGINNQLKKGLSEEAAAFRSYLGPSFSDFEHIVLNRRNCKDPLNNRNDNMASNFITYARSTNDSMYYGELGEAHTVLNHRDVGSLINQAPGFKDRVASVNLYCDQCTTEKEAVSNWPLHQIEKDIVAHFLPLCTGDFTLFDLTGPSPVIARYKAYGPFLIIARNQHN
jgi:hypothetical protein